MSDSPGDTATARERGRVLRALRRIAVDVAPLRGSRDLRLLTVGNFVTGLGTQATLVALPYQLYVQTRSPVLRGLLGAVELGPLVAMSLFGGALADRMDRKRLLLLDQLALVAIAGALAAGAFAGRPPLALLYVLAAMLAGFSAIQNVARSAIALAGLVRSLWGAIALFALAGAADSVSAVCRSTINQTVTPDAMRGRMSAVFSLVVTSGPRLGDIESARSPRW